MLDKTNAARNQFVLIQFAGLLRFFGGRRFGCKVSAALFSRCG